MPRLRRWLARLGEPHPAWPLLEAPGPEPELRPEDVFLVSYPRSGNTWTRAVIGYLMVPPERIGSMNELNQLIPGIHRGIPATADTLTPRVLKSHRAFPYRHRRDNPALYRRVIYVVRHPFEVVRSLHLYNRAGRPGETLQRTLEQFVLGVSEWGSWQDHVLSWKAEESRRDMLFMRYEDLAANFATTVAALARFLGRPATPQLVEDIARRTTRQALEELERKDSGGLLRQAEIPQDAERELSPRERNWITESFGYAMGLFGYTGEAKR